MDLGDSDGDSEHPSLPGLAALSSDGEPQRSGQDGGGDCSSESDGEHDSAGGNPAGDNEPAVLESDERGDMSDKARAECGVRRHSCVSIVCGDECCCDDCYGW